MVSLLERTILLGIGLFVRPDRSEQARLGAHECVSSGVVTEGNEGHDMVVSCVVQDPHPVGLRCRCDEGLLGEPTEAASPPGQGERHGRRARDGAAAERTVLAGWGGRALTKGACIHAGTIGVEGTELEQAAPKARWESGRRQPDWRVGAGRGARPTQTPGR
ncbi:MAG: hypothetical protein NVS3B12_14590 [Acidimicrobiales bacterium]